VFNYLTYIQLNVFSNQIPTKTIMKTQTIITSFALVLFLALNFYSCKTSTSESKKADDKAEMVSKAFEVELIGDYMYVGPDTLLTPKCFDTLLPLRVIVDGKGTSELMGEVTGHFDFCVHWENGNYGNTYAYIVDKGNDTLFVSCEGVVLPGKEEEHPSYVTSYWKDDFVILGGTGKYAGASGEGKTDDYNSSEDPNSHHQWKGTITMLK